MEFIRREEKDSELIELFKAILKPRMIEEKMLILLRQGKISKWFSGIGQEAVSVGVVEAMQDDEYILPMHRNLGVFTGRKIPLKKLFAQFQGKESGFTKGRDRSFHFGSNEYRIVGMISHLGSQMGVADGIALGEKLKSSGKMAAVFTGDGGSSEGDFHEAMNVASVWDLPLLVVVENNGYGLSTPSAEQFRFRSFVDKAPGYGIEAFSVDGNNLLQVYQMVRDLSYKIRTESRPILLECMTFRMRGHEEASGTKYVPKEVMEYWAEKDPVEHYRNYMFSIGLLNDELEKQIRDEISSEINEAWKESEKEKLAEFNKEIELWDVYAEVKTDPQAPEKEANEMRFIDALRDALDVSLEKHPNLILMGQDIADYGGVFKVTEGLLEKYGKDRVRNTPLCEAAILGAALGLSVKGYKSMVEMQFADFVSEGFNQIVNNLAKSHWRWGQNADVVIRMPTGAGVNAGPFHSQSNEAWFFHTPGLKIVYPSNPEDAKGLLIRAFEDLNPVMFFEHKKLYRSVKGNVPAGYYSLEFGRAKVVREGTELSIITYGMGVHWALEWAENNPDQSVEIIDLRTLVPLDWETVYSSVRKTGKALVLHEDTLTGGIGGEISSRITEDCFTHLDAPVKRVGALDTPVPFSDNLEKGFLPQSILNDRILELIKY